MNIDFIPAAFINMLLHLGKALTPLNVKIVK